MLFNFSHNLLQTHRTRKTTLKAETTESGISEKQFVIASFKSTTHVDEQGVSS